MRGRHGVRKDLRKPVNVCMWISMPSERSIRMDRVSHACKPDKLDDIRLPLISQGISDQFTIVSALADVRERFKIGPGSD